MATWPTYTELQTWKKKLSAIGQDNLEAAIESATEDVLGAMVDLYDVSDWDTTAPPAMIVVVKWLAYGYATYATHTGDKASPSDETGKEILDLWTKKLERYASGAVNFVDPSTGAAWARRDRATRAGLSMLDEPVFGLRGAENYRLTLPDTDDLTEWSNGQ